MKSIDRISVTDQVVKEIKGEILKGTYPEGTKLPSEKELCSILNVGRSTVREALRVLQAMGFVEIKQGRGAFVLNVQEESREGMRAWFSAHELELLDFMHVRQSIETLAVRLTVERASNSEIEGIERIMDMFEKALAEEDEIKLAAADEAFHTAIAEASHNNLLIMISKEFASAFKAYRLRSFAVRENARNALSPHLEILDALKSRDAERGTKAMTMHLEISRRDIHRVVSGSQGSQ